MHTYPPGLGALQAHLKKKCHRCGSRITISTGSSMRIWSAWRSRREICKRKESRCKTSSVLWKREKILSGSKKSTPIMSPKTMATLPKVSIVAEANYMTLLPHCLTCATTRLMSHKTLVKAIHNCWIHSQAWVITTIMQLSVLIDLTFTRWVGHQRPRMAFTHPLLDNHIRTKMACQIRISYGSSHALSPKTFRCQICQVLIEKWVTVRELALVIKQEHIRVIVITRSTRLPCQT